MYFGQFCPEKIELRLEIKMLEGLKEPIDKLKNDIDNVWGRL